MDVLIEDVDVYQPLARQMNARAALIVPVLGDRGAVGVMAAVNKRGTDDTFSADDQRLAEAFAARVAVAVRLVAGGARGGGRSAVVSGRALVEVDFDESGGLAAAALAGIPRWSHRCCARVVRLWRWLILFRG